MQQNSLKLLDHTPSGPEWILWKAYQVFRQKGYYHTSMADIGEVCGLKKGSLYHYFPSKEALTKAVLELAYGQFQEKVFALARQKEPAPRQRLQRILETMDALYFDQQGGCLMARMALEVANKIPEFTPVIRAYFKEWIEAFDALFQDQHAPDPSRQLAHQAVAELEGAILLACLFEDKSYFAAACERILNYLK